MKLRLIVFLQILTAVFFLIPINSQVFVEADVNLVASGFQFTEGPVWLEGEGLLFSDIPANKVYLWNETNGATDYVNPSGNSNGLGFNNEDTLILCQHGPRQLGKLDNTNSIVPLATHYDGKRLNSPNDLCFHSDGSIFFTDPPYGLSNPNDTETGFNGVYRLNPNGEVQLLDSTLSRPNGIAFSPDESILYVAETSSRKIYAWDITDDSIASNKREFVHLNASGDGADGMKVDAEGYIYATGPNGIWVVAPDGTVLNTISVPGQTTNCAWGDADKNALYVTSGNAIYKLTKKEEQPSSLKERWKGSESNLFVNYPNPFVGSTTIPLSLARRSNVVLSVYNAMGKKIATLVDAEMDQGNHSIVWESENLSVGPYYIVLYANGKETVIYSEKISGLN